MGQVLSAVRDEVKASSEEGMKGLEFTLDNLQELANTKSKLFYSNLLSNSKTREYNVNKVSNLQIKTFVLRKDQGVDKVAENVKDSIGQIMNEEYLGGIVSLVQSALDMVLGSGSGSQSETRMYYVFSHGIGISRVDFYAYKRSVQFQSFTALAEKVCVIAWAVSSIDVNRMKRADLNHLVSKMHFAGKDGEPLDDMHLLDIQAGYAKRLADVNGMKFEADSSKTDQLQSGGTKQQRNDGAVVENKEVEDERPEFTPWVN